MTWRDRIQRDTRTVDTPSPDSVGRTIFRLASKLGFVFLSALLFLATLRVDIALLSFAAALLLGQALYVVLPIHRIRARLNEIWTGEAGEDVYEETVHGDHGRGILRWFE